MTVGKVGDGYIEIHADADRADRDLDHATRNRKAKIDVNLAVSTAAARLARLARDRIVWVKPILDNKAMLVVQTALLRLSGIRSFTDMAQHVVNIVKNIDQLAPKVAGISIAFLGLAGSALALTSNLSGVAYSLGQIVGAGIAAPALLLGLGATFGVLKIALKDLGKQFKDLGLVMQAMKKQVQGAFWVQAERPLRTMMGTLIPGLRVQLNSLSTELGATFGSVAGILSTQKSLGILNEMLYGTAVSANVAREGFNRFTRGFLTLVQGGTKYLPILGNWFSALGSRFEAWASQMVETGKFDTWMKVALTQLKALGSALKGAFGILAAFGKAAQAAGGSTLESFARSLNRVSKALNSVGGQVALIKMFEGGHKAMAAMTPGLDALGRSLRDSIIPMFTQAMPAAGVALGSVFGTLAKILSNPVFTSGVTAMLSGAGVALSALEQNAEPLANVLGALARAFGVVAANIGLLPAGLAPLSPALVGVLDLVSALVQVMSGVFIKVMTTVGPVVSSVVVATTSWMQANARFVAGAAAAVVLLVKLAASWQGMMEWVATAGKHISVFTKALSGGKGLFGALNQVSAGLGTFLKFAGIVGMLISMYAASENFRRTVNSLALSLGKILGAAFIALGQVLTAVGPLFTAISRLLGDIAAIMLQKVVVAMKILTPIFQVGFLAIGAVVTAVVKIITGLVQGLAKLLEGDFSGAWASVTGGVDGARGALARVAAPLAAFWALAQKVVGTVVAWVQTHKGLAAAIGGLQAGATVVTIILKRMVTAAIASQVAGGAVNNLGTKFSALGSVLRKHPLFMIAGILLSLGAAFAVAQAQGGNFAAVLGPIGDKIKGVIDMIPGIVKGIAGMLPGLISSVTGALPGIITSVMGALTSLGTAVVGALPKIADAFMGLWNGLLTAVPVLLQKIAPVLLQFFSSTLPGLITQGAQAFAGFIGQVAAVIAAALPQLATTVASMVTTFGQVLSTMIPVVVSVLTSLLSTVITLLVQVITSIAQNLSQILPPLIAGVTSLISAVAGMLPTLIPILIQAGMTLFMGLLQALITVLPVIISGVTTLINAVAAMLPTLIPMLVQPAITLFTGLVQALAIIVPALLAAILGVVMMIVGMLPTLIPALIEAAITLFMALVQAIPVILEALIPAVIQVILAVVNLLPTLIPVLIQAAVTLFMALVNALPQIIAALIPAVIQVIMAVVRMLPSLIGALMNAAVQLFMALVKAVPQILGALLSAIGTLLSALFQAVMSADTQLMNAARNLMDGLIRGLRNAAGAVRDAILNVIKGAVDAVKNFFGIHSPSTLMMTMGVNVDKGFIKGLDSMIGDVEDAAGRLSMAAVFDPAMNGLGTVRAPKTAAAAPSELAAAPTTLALPSGGVDLTDASVMALAVALAKVLWPAARAAQIVEDLATNGPTRLAKGIA